MNIASLLKIILVLTSTILVNWNASSSDLATDFFQMVPKDVKKLIFLFAMDKDDNALKIYATLARVNKSFYQVTSSLEMKRVAEKLFIRGTNSKRTHHNLILLKSCPIILMALKGMPCKTEDEEWQSLEANFTTSEHLAKKSVSYLLDNKKDSILYAIINSKIIPIEIFRKKCIKPIFNSQNLKIIKHTIYSLDLYLICSYEITSWNSENMKFIMNYTLKYFNFFYSPKYNMAFKAEFLCLLDYAIKNENFNVYIPLLLQKLKFLIQNIREDPKAYYLQQPYNSKFLIKDDNGSISSIIAYFIRVKNLEAIVILVEHFPELSTMPLYLNSYSLEPFPLDEKFFQYSLSLWNYDDSAKKALFELFSIYQFEYTFGDKKPAQGCDIQ